MVWRPAARLHGAVDKQLERFKDLQAGRAVRRQHLQHNHPCKEQRRRVQLYVVRIAVRAEALMVDEAHVRRVRRRAEASRRHEPLAQADARRMTRGRCAPAHVRNRLATRERVDEEALARPLLADHGDEVDGRVAECAEHGRALVLHVHRNRRHRRRRAARWRRFRAQLQPRHAGDDRHGRCDWRWDGRCASLRVVAQPHAECEAGVGRALLDDGGQRRVDRPMQFGHRASSIFTARNVRNINGHQQHLAGR